MADARTRRLWLYGTALVAVAVLAFLWIQRRRTDEADRVQYLRQVLDNLDLVMSVDPRTALDALDREFRDPDLPRDLQGDVLRARAFAHAKLGERDVAEARLGEAAALDPGAHTQAAIRIERALVRSALGDADGAVEVLAGWSPPDDPVLILWTALAQADAERIRGATAAAVRILEGALAGLEAPLPEGPSRRIALTSWAPRMAARQASGGLVALAGEGGAAPIWARLQALDPTWTGPDQAEGPGSGRASGDPAHGLKPDEGPGR